MQGEREEIFPDVKEILFQNTNNIVVSDINAFCDKIGECVI